MIRFRSKSSNKFHRVMFQRVIDKHSPIWYIDTMMKSSFFFAHHHTSFPNGLTADGW
jgi:hypothetical protein